MMYLFMSVAIVFYSLWCVDPITSEKFFLYKWLEKIPQVFSRLYVLIIVLISWIIFDTILAVIVIWGHRGNLSRLFKNTENCL